MLSKQAGRAAVYIGGGALLVAWLAAANTSRPPDPPEPAVPARTADRGDLSILQNEAAQLRQRLASAPAPSTARNPFSFAQGPAIRAIEERRTVSAPAAAETPLEPAPMPLTLVGIAEQSAASGPERTAILGGTGDEMYMVTVGQTIAARYSVTAIDVDAIELKDLATGGFRRLALK